MLRRHGIPKELKPGPEMSREEEREAAWKRRIERDARQLLEKHDRQIAERKAAEMKKQTRNDLAKIEKLARDVQRERETRRAERVADHVRREEEKTKLRKQAHSGTGSALERAIRRSTSGAFGKK
jgi:uncharacterized protein YcbK (DUF882 family)